MNPRRSAKEIEPHPEADRLGEFPHPRSQTQFFGHENAVAEIVRAVRSGRMHHALLLSGPKGVGKATLGWRLARALLAYGAENLPDDLEVSRDHPVVHQIDALAHSDALLVRRPWDEKTKKFKKHVRNSINLKPSLKRTKRNNWLK